MDHQDTGKNLVLKENFKEQALGRKRGRKEKRARGRKDKPDPVPEAHMSIRSAQGNALRRRESEVENNSIGRVMNVPRFPMVSR